MPGGGGGVASRGVPLSRSKDVMRRMLIVGNLMSPDAGEMTRFDKAVIRQSAIARVLGELILEHAEMRRYPKPVANWLSTGSWESAKQCMTALGSGGRPSSSDWRTKLSTKPRMLGTPFGTSSPYSCMLMSANNSPSSRSGMHATSRRIAGLFQTWISSMLPSGRCQGLLSVPSRPSKASLFGYKYPSMQSNERFSSIKTTTCSILGKGPPARLSGLAF